MPLLKSHTALARSHEFRDSSPYQGVGEKGRAIHGIGIVSPPWDQFTHDHIQNYPFLTPKGNSFCIQLRLQCLSEE